jgi:hypothetical protein
MESARSHFAIVLRQDCRRFLQLDAHNVTASAKFSMKTTSDVSIAENIPMNANAMADFDFSSPPKAS